jgi:pimeloyl-ACP methyl ester carboxylesterase
LDYKHTKVSGLSVRYVDTGGSKNAVLLLHGLGGSIESWINNIREMSQSVRVVVVDLPGFGMSDKPKMNYTIKFYQEFVIQFLKSLQISRASIIGSSLGGHVAAEIAISHPDVVDRLVLISPPGALPSSFKGTPALKKYVKVVDAKTVRQVKQALFAIDNKPVGDDYARLVHKKMSMPGAKEAFLSALKGSAQAPRLTGRLNRIHSSTLLLWGKEDAMIPVKFAEPFVKMKNCRIILIENCGHRPHAERPELFNKTVVDFLAG